MEDDTTTTVKTENSEASQKKRLRPLTSMYYKPVKEGFLVKRGHWIKSWKKRYFCIFTNGTMKYFLSRKDYVDGRVLGTFSLKGCSLKECSQFADKKFCFEVSCPDNVSFFMQCSDETDKKDWMDMISSVIMILQHR